jgi:hypothetical protein
MSEIRWLFAHGKRAHAFTKPTGSSLCGLVVADELAVAADEFMGRCHRCSKILPHIHRRWSPNLPPPRPTDDVFWQQLATGDQGHAFYVGEIRAGRMKSACGEVTFGTPEPGLKRPTSARDYYCERCWEVVFPGKQAP